MRFVLKNDGFHKKKVLDGPFLVLDGSVMGIICLILTHFRSWYLDDTQARVLSLRAGHWKVWPSRRSKCTYSGEYVYITKATICI